MVACGSPSPRSYFMSISNATPRKCPVGVDNALASAARPLPLHHQPQHWLQGLAGFLLNPQMVWKGVSILVYNYAATASGGSLGQIGV